MENTDGRASGNSFIDENHEGLLNHINSLEVLVRDDWEQIKFTTEIRDFIVALENHFHHEETILKGAKYEGLDQHTFQHRKVSMNLHKEAFQAHDNDSAIQFLADVRTQIFSHELFEDQLYWPVFETEKPDTDVLILWSPEIETGDPEDG